jgi:hypothetical protein
MLSPAVYKVVHLFGVLVVFVSLGALSLHAMNGGTKESNSARRLVSASYGIGLLLIIVAGFGWLAQSEALAGGVPGWAWAKLGIWLLVGASLALPYRRPHLARALWVVGPLLGAAAALLAITKPF